MEVLGIRSGTPSGRIKVLLSQTSQPVPSARILRLEHAASDTFEKHILFLAQQRIEMLKKSHCDPSLQRFDTTSNSHSCGTAEQPGHGIQRPQFIGVNWRPLYLAIITHLHTAKRHSLTESQEQEIRKLFDEFTRTATVETHDQLLKLTQAKIQEVLTREQDEAVRREIWLGWNVTKFRDARDSRSFKSATSNSNESTRFGKHWNCKLGRFKIPRRHLTYLSFSDLIDLPSKAQNSGNVVSSMRSSRF